MKLKDYLSEKIIFIFINLFAVIMTIVILKALSVDNYPIAFIVTLNILSSLIFYLNDFYKKNKYLNELNNNLESLDKKYFISEIMKAPDFIEGKVLFEVLEQTNKSMKDDVAELERNIQEYKEYIEMWVHEVKTPIASTKLLLDNNHSPLNENIEEEIDRIENYIEQVLFYAKSNDIYKDYLVKQINLKNSINTVIKRNANILIEKSVKIELQDIDKDIFCDSKWLEFILQQIVINSIKYMDKDNKVLKFSCKENKGKLFLEISDNGIGMDEKTVKKAFEKGYTGENGRKFSKSTGIGLYLCKKLCDKLGLEIAIQSEIDVGTEVIIGFIS